MAVIGRLIAVLEAQTADFQARMTAAERVMARFESANTTATRGLRLVRGGMEQLASAAIGAHGPVGRLAEGLLHLGGGAALGAVAALGSIVIMSHASAKVLDDVAAAARRSEEAFAGMLAQGRPLVAAMRQMVDLQGQLDDMQEKTTSGGGLGTAALIALSHIVPGLADYLESRSVAGAVQTSGVTNRLALATQRAIDEHTATELAGALTAFTAGLEKFDLSRVPGGPGTPSIGLNAPNFGTQAVMQAYEQARVQAERNAAAEIRRAENLAIVNRLEDRGATITQVRLRGVQAINELESLGIISKKEAAQAMRGLNAAIKDTSRAAQLAAAQMVTAFAQVLAAVVGGGSFGSIVTGVGGLLSFVNPLAGAIVGGLGTIITAVQARSDNAEEVRHEELIQTLTDTRGIGTIVIPRDIDPNDPAFMDKITQTIRNIGDLRILTVTP